MFLGCSYFFSKSEADVLINSVLRQNAACNPLFTEATLTLALDEAVQAFSETQEVVEEDVDYLVVDQD